MRARLRPADPADVDVRHTRGTPPAVIETDAATWIALATGTTGWA